MSNGKWVNISKLKTSKMVHAGTDEDGSPIYVGRINYGNETIPGKYVTRPSGGQFYYSFGGVEHEDKKKSFYILVDDGYSWDTVQSADGRVPFNAVIGGESATGEAYYIGRACHEGVWTPGKIDTLDKCLYIPFGCEELRFDSYYVLVRTTKSFNGSLTSNELNEDDKNSSEGCCGGLGRFFTSFRINITNCTCFKIN